MAQLETWIRQDLKNPLQVQYLNGTMFSQDNAANLVGVEVFDDGEPATLGGSVSANVVRSDGGTVAVSGGTLSGNRVSVILPQAAYAIPGAISIIIKLTAGGTVTTLGAIVVTVYRSSTDEVVDPGTIIPSVQNLISQIETVVASIPADYSSLWASLAPAFSTSTAYTAGQHMTYNGHLYRFTADHAAGSFVNTDCTQVDVGSELSSLKSAISSDAYLGNLYYYGNTAYGQALSSGANGATSSNETSNTTDYIDVSNIKLLYGNESSGGRYWFYKEDKTPIDGNERTGKISTGQELIPNSGVHYIEVPTSAVYFRISFSKDAPSALYLSGTNMYELFLENKTQETLKKLFVDHENVWDLTEITDGKGVNSSGQIVDSSSYSVTDYIPVYGLKSLYCRNTARYAFYDSNKTYISNSSKNTASQPVLYDDIHIVAVPENAYYFVICAVTENTDKLTYSPSVVEMYLKEFVESRITDYFYNKKLGVVGHSGPQGMRLSNLSDAWPYVTSANLLMASIQNNAVGGATIAKQENSYEDIYFSLEDFQAATKDVTKRYLVKDAPTNPHPFMLYEYNNSEWAPISSSRTAVNGARSPVVDVIRSLDADVDAIIIGAGANDYSYAWTPIGTFTDRTKNTFYGALHVLLSYIMSTYKGIPVFFTDAIIPATIGERGTEINAIGKTYDDYRNAIIEVCQYYRVPWIDIDRETNFPTADIDASWYADDLKHMSKKGHQRIGEFVAGKIKNYLVI